MIIILILEDFHKQKPKHLLTKSLTNQLRERAKKWISQALLRRLTKKKWKNMLASIRVILLNITMTSPRTTKIFTSEPDSMTQGNVLT